MVGRELDLREVITEILDRESWGPAIKLRNKQRSKAELMAEAQRSIPQGAVIRSVTLIKGLGIGAPITEIVYDDDPSTGANDG